MVCPPGKRSGCASARKCVGSTPAHNIFGGYNLTEREGERGN